MPFSLSTNFDHNLITQVKNFDIKKIYGKLSRDIFGGGRSSVLLPEVSRKHIKEHVEIAHKNGIEFDYLLNSTCINNIEHTKAGLKAVYEELEWLRSIKVDWITVSIPFLIEIIKKAAPEIKIGLSVSAHVDSLEKARHFERMGVDEITLPESLNRNFGLLKKISKNINCDIRLIATNSCVIGCPYKKYHGNYLSHTSQSNNNASSQLLVDMCYLKCTRYILENPVELIKACWIRPEDLQYYEDIGIKNFKLTERNKNTPALLKTASAYYNRSYDGYLSDLLSLADSSHFLSPNFQVIFESGMFSNSSYMDAIKLYSYRKFKIRNQALNGFLEFFVNEEIDCLNRNCGSECRYCYKYINDCLEINEEENRIAMGEIDSYFKDFYDVEE
ncbi:MAG: U32 family peptidase [Clostridia bacterium]|nr:U32 family peptidase [Clostridia bacterium]